MAPIAGEYELLERTGRLSEKRPSRERGFHGVAAAVNPGAGKGSRETKRTSATNPLAQDASRLARILLQVAESQDAWAWPSSCREDAL